MRFCYDMIIRVMYEQRVHYDFASHDHKEYSMVRTDMPVFPYNK